MTLQTSMAPDLRPVRRPKVSSPATRLPTVTSLPSARRPWESLGQRLIRFLMFVYGPADIGPLGPPMTPHASRVATGAPTADVQRQRIRVIPVQ